MPIDTRCPQCQAKLRIGDEFAGQQARCPLCNEIYLVPATSAPPSAELAETPSEAGQVEPQPGIQIDTAPIAIAPSPAATTVVAPILLPPPDGTQWYLRTPEGPVYGPTTAEVFDRWVQEGRVTPDCEVCAGDNLWQPAAQLFPRLTAGKPGPARPLQPDSWSPTQKPHRGTLILALGLLAIVTTCPVAAVMAWVMGSSDLLDMQNGRMDPGGEKPTQVGRVLGMILSLIYVGVAVIGTFVVLFVMAQG